MMPRLRPFDTISRIAVGLAALVVLCLAMAFDKAKVKSLTALEQARGESERTAEAMQIMMTQVTRSIHAASSASREIASSTTLMARTMTEQRHRADDMVQVTQQMAVVTRQNAEQTGQHHHQQRQTVNRQVDRNAETRDPRQDELRLPLRNARRLGQ